MNQGKDISNPKLANLVSPIGHVTVQTTQGPMQVDMHKFAVAADKLGAGKYDVLGISGYRNAKGELVPDYDSVRIEKYHNG